MHGDRVVMLALYTFTFMSGTPLHTGCRTELHCMSPKMLYISQDNARLIDSHSSLMYKAANVLFLSGDRMKIM